jgi:hypothetical protein
VTILSCEMCSTVFRVPPSQVKAGRRFCSLRCHKSLLTPRSADDVFRFCTPEPNSGCWFWNGKLDKNGYGQVDRPDLHTKSAHKLSWALHFGLVPDGLFVCHRCDCPPCVNPDHLFLGTPHDNSIDAMNKDRVAFGERHGRAKLTERDVIAIRQSAEPQRSLADMYGVSNYLIYLVQKRLIWRRVV